MLASLGERWEDGSGTTYESIGPNQPEDFDPENYGGKIPMWMLEDGDTKATIGKKYFRTVPPGTLKKHPNKNMPLEWMRRIEGFPTS